MLNFIAERDWNLLKQRCLERVICLNSVMGDPCGAALDCPGPPAATVTRKCFLPRAKLASLSLYFINWVVPLSDSPRVSFGAQAFVWEMEWLNYYHRHLAIKLEGLILSEGSQRWPYSEICSFFFRIWPYIILLISLSFVQLLCQP